PLLEAGTASQRRRRRIAAAAAPSPPGHRPARRAGRDVEPAASWRHRRQAAGRGPPHRRDGDDDRDRADVGHPRLLRHRRGRRRSARFGGAARVHTGGRHREPHPTAAAVGRTGPDGAQRSHLQGCPGTRRRDPARAGAGERSPSCCGRLFDRRPYRRSCTVNVVEARGVRKTYDSEAAPVRALRGVDLDVPAGEFVAIMGPSGCGKSTLLNLIAGLDVPSDGEIVLAGESLAGKDENALARMRRVHIGIVFQFFNLLEGMTVLENVTLPAVIAGMARRAAESRARDLLDLLGLGDKAKNAPGVLSGGPRQRLAIARALANEPTLVLADEPTGALDSAGGLEVLELFRRLHSGGQAILMVTHDQKVADAASRIVHMRDGRVDDGTEEDMSITITESITSTTWEP